MSLLIALLVLAAFVLSIVAVLLVSMGRASSLVERPLPGLTRNRT